MAGLDGHAYVVTGAAGGIGSALCRELAGAGARLLINDMGCNVHGVGRDPERVNALASELRSIGAEPLVSADDVRTPGSAESLVEAAIAGFGRLDGAVTCAGVVCDRLMTSLSGDDLDLVLGTNFLSAARLARAAARVLSKGDGGSLVLMSSPTALFGAARQSAPDAAAAALVGFCRAAAAELQKHCVRINVLAPTARTRATQDLGAFQGISPDALGPNAVAKVATYLLSDAARAVTGEVIGVAGSRVYAIRARETAGAFCAGDDLSAAGLRAAWPDVIRG